jgi:hypothetical protein
MAAVNLKHQDGVFHLDDVRQMVEVATRAFSLAVESLKERPGELRIHTGNWGAGAFLWSPRASFLIQRFAFAAALASFDEALRVRVHLQYHAFNEATAAAIGTLICPERLTIRTRRFSIAELP